MPKQDEPVRVLVVDDERFGRAYPRWMLTQRFGVEVLEAENALKALEILSENKVDAIITDLVMPGLDGLEMLRFIRADPKNAGAEIVVASAYSYEQSVRRAIQMGVGDFLTKPFQPAEMEKKFAALLNRVARNRRSRADPEAVRERLRVLVVDSDPNFCSFAVSALAGRYTVQHAASGLEAVVLVNNWNPDLLLINPQLRGLELKFLLDQIWNLGLSRGIRVYLIGDEGDNTQAVDRRVAGWIRRTFVPEAFCASIIYILEPTAITAHSALDWLKKLEPEIVSAVRQVFGMMTEMEAVPLEIHEPPQSTHFCSVDLHSESGLRMLLELGCSRSLALKLVMKLTALEESLIDEELLESGVAEVINVVGGRIKESCRARDLHLKMELPALKGAPLPAITSPLFHWMKHFQWTADEIFGLSLTCFQDSPGPW